MDLAENCVYILRQVHSIQHMTMPLALMIYDNLLPGSQLVNRLHDQDYRVITLTEGSGFVALAKQEKPFVILIDLVSKHGDMCSLIKDLKSDPDTAYIPILAFTSSNNTSLQLQARTAGANLVAIDRAILTQLPDLLEQVIHLE